ncbi:MAG: M48 family metalloprotease [Alphaproteobacteria bacterium]|nr:M48 family metalloprotease [Alphaproteobacteria bacterium]
MALRAVVRPILWVLVAVLALGEAAVAHDESAGNRVSLLRDTEIEADIHVMMTPIWKAAGLDPEALHVYLVSDDSINSFVAGGQNIFINSGLLLRADKPNQLVGVLSHETGHIAGGHLYKGAEAMHNASIEEILAMAAAVAATVASRGSGGGGALLGAAGVGQRAYLSFSVTQEATADHAAMNYLDATRQSARGLLQFFEKLQTEELLIGTHEDPYLMDHPLTQQRIDYVREHVERSPYSNNPDPPLYVEMLKRCQAKTAAFTEPPASTLAKYPEQDRSVLARYARAIAYYRMPDLDKALPSIDALIRDAPRDPYFRELKGQMLFENGRISEAVQPYEDALRLNPGAPLLRIELAQVYIENNDPAQNKRAIAYLSDALRTEDKDVDGWHLLATAYGRDNQIGMAALSLAEEGLAADNKKNALAQAVRAEHLLPKSSVAHARAQVIYSQAKELEGSD